MIKVPNKRQEQLNKVTEELDRVLDALLDTETIIRTSMGDTKKQFELRYMHISAAIGISTLIKNLKDINWSYVPPEA